MALAWATLEDAIYTWFVAASGLSRVYWAEQNVPQRDETFAVLKIIAGPIQVGTADQVALTTNLAAPGAEVVHTVHGDREMTLNCQVVSRTITSANTARDYLSKAQTGLFLPTRRAALQTAGWAPIDAGAITDLTALMGPDFHSRASMDVRFRIRDTATESTGYIATVDFAIAVS